MVIDEATAVAAGLTARLKKKRRSSHKSKKVLARLLDLHRLSVLCTIAHGAALEHAVLTAPALLAAATARLSAVLPAATRLNVDLETGAVAVAELRALLEICDQAFDFTGDQAIGWIESRPDLPASEPEFDDYFRSALRLAIGSQKSDNLLQRVAADRIVHALNGGDTGGDQKTSGDSLPRPALDHSSAAAVLVALVRSWGGLARIVVASDPPPVRGHKAGESWEPRRHSAAMRAKVAAAGKPGKKRLKRSQTDVIDLTGGDTASVEINNDPSGAAGAAAASEATEPQAVVRRASAPISRKKRRRSSAGRRLSQAEVERRQRLRRSHGAVMVWVEVFAVGERGIPRWVPVVCDGLAIDDPTACGTCDAFGRGSQALPYVIAFELGARYR